MTSTDLTTAAAPVVTAESTALIERTAASLGQAHTIASALVQTAFAPPHFKGKPEEGAAAILYGAQIGLDPLAALQNIYVISGRPALYARTMVAVVLAAGHKIWTEESTDQRVTVSGQRKGSADVETVSWTIERAKLAGYTSNKKYATDPQAMLYARAAGDVARRIAPDALLGLTYSVEEMQVVEATDVTPRRRQRAADILTPDEPMAPDEPTAGDQPDPLTDKTRAHLFALLNKAGITDPDVQRAGMSKILGREVESRSTLTEDEGRALIVELEARAAQGGEE